MTTKAAIFALLSLWGVGTVGSLPAMAQDTSTPATESTLEDDGDDLTDRVWVKTGDEAALPGIMKIFLSDGTLVQDSCWETHRLSSWHAAEDMSLTWDEDGMAINAEVVTLNAEELVLSLKLIGGDVEERYVPATVPYVCPDMPKG